MQNKSWRTTLCGLVGGIPALLLGLWSFHVLWVPNQTPYFNLVYVENAPMALIVVGIGVIFIGLHARDHKAEK